MMLTDGLLHPQGKTFQKPYICMLCKKENEGLPTDVMETHQEAGGDVSVDTTFQSLQSLKRKASSMHSPQESTAGRNPVRASSGADTPTSKIAEELMELLGGDLASKISALQANLEAFPLGKNAPMPQARASETGQPKELDHGANCSPAASMCSALPNKEPAQRAAASHLFASETETEDHNLLDTMLQEITDLSNAELRW